jgi:hypothetical protein
MFFSSSSIPMRSLPVPSLPMGATTNVRRGQSESYRRFHPKTHLGVIFLLLLLSSSFFFFSSFFLVLPI